MITVVIDKAPGAANVIILRSDQTDAVIIPPDQLRIIQSGDNLTLVDGLFNTQIVRELPYTQFKDILGDPLGVDVPTVVAAIDAILIA
jgi:hypothetical protein